MTPEDANDGRPRSEIDVVIVGGGPAGMVLALLLVRRGLRVKVLERNPDFEREFRGEILQPRFWHAMAAAGLSEILQSMPHEDFNELRLFSSGQILGFIPVSSLDPVYPFVTWMTQPDMLRGLQSAASSNPEFALEFNANATELLRENGSVCGVRYKNAQDQAVDLRSKVVVGCDGRFSKIRKLEGFELSHKTHQFDVIWFETERPECYRHGADFFLGAEFNSIVLPKYPNKIQCGILIAPGSFKHYKEMGVDVLIEKLNDLHAMFRCFSRDLVDFKSFTLLAGTVERVKEWAKDGLLLIGDAAHTCSPAGAIGVTIAVESAIIADQVLANCFKNNDFSREALGEVQRRREPEVIRVHNAQERIGFMVANRMVPGTLLEKLASFILRSGILPRILRGLLSRAETNPLLGRK